VLGLVSKTRYARSGDLRIAYELRGVAVTRRPALLLIQGLGFDRAGWGPAIGSLQRRFRLVLIDNRCSGRSPAAGSFSVADMAGDALAVLDDAGIGAAHVLGASLGGMIAQEFAVRHPDRVNRLVLACTTPGWPFAYPMPLPSAALIAASQRLAPDEALRRHVENALSVSTVAERPELAERIIDCQPSVSARDPDAWQAQAMAGARYAGSFRQRRIRARTLILHGTADRVVDPRNARLLADRIEHADLVTFPGLGHLFFWEDSDAFAAAVTSFLHDKELRICRKITRRFLRIGQDRALL
jgi:3-oxoadipate enol-lactonase